MMQAVSRIARGRAAGIWRAAVAAPRPAAAAAVRSYAAEAKSRTAHFPGATCPLTNELDIRVTSKEGAMPCLQVMNADGDILNESLLPEVPDEELVRWYKLMVKQNQMDNILYESQRQGRISFYMTSFGEEATHIGSAACLSNEDVIYAQYRETGVLLYRGYGLDEFMNQCYANVYGHGKGRQMPVHYGSKRLNFHTISSPLGTQLPQAAGAAFKLKGSGNCVVCYFGDGSASEGDAHPAFNFAATLECPVIFFCRNNGWAISTPTKEQYRGDGIASRASGYGIDALRVDGNDLFAVYAGMKAARESVTKNSRPLILEAMTYRIGHHSTSDDWSAYRAKDEVELWTRDSPITRFGKFLRKRGLWDDAKEEDATREAAKHVLDEFNKAEKRLRAAPFELFEDVYDKVPPQLERQRKSMLAHLEKYGGHYPMHLFEKGDAPAQK